MKTALKNLGKKERKLVKATKLGLPISDVTTYIEFLEHKCASNKIELNKAEENLESAKELYTQAQNEYNILKEHQDKYEKSYQHALAFEKNPHATEVSFYNADVPDEETKKRKKPLSWIPMAAAVLEKQDRFMDARDIIATIFRENPTLRQQALITYKGEGTAFNLISRSITDHAMKAGKGRMHGTQLLSIYQEKIGRIEWVNKENQQPHPKYIKGFIGIEKSEEAISV